MITNITNNLKISGVYKITYDNNKIYIGQALSIWARAHEHNSKNHNVCDKALKKHNAQIEVLEQVNDILLLDEIEKKWIQYYNSTDKNIGYNILAGGNASGKRGIENCNSIFTEDTLKEVVDLLQNRLDLSYKDIAKIYNTSPGTIYRISKGYSYFNPLLNYPLREFNHDSNKKNLVLDYFENEDELLSLKEDLKFRWDLSLENDLPKLYNIPADIVREINLGRKFENIGEFIYPIRAKNIRNIYNFTQQDILNILNDLRNTKMSMSEIGKKYNIHRDTVSNINQGKNYIIKDYQYPAR